MCKCRSMQSGEQLVHLNFRKVRGRKRSYMNTHTITYIYICIHISYTLIYYVHTYLPAYLPTCQPANLPPCLPTCLPTYLRTCAPAYPTCTDSERIQQHNNTTTQQPSSTRTIRFQDTMIHTYIYVHVYAYAPKTVLAKCRFLTFLIWGGLGGVGGVITFLASVSRWSSFFYDGMLR